MRVGAIALVATSAWLGMTTRVSDVPPAPITPERTPLEPAETAMRPTDDADGDGLTDFDERHKYLTDPARADTDGDGTPDGDWDERREHTYSVRAIMRIAPPYDVRAMNDEHQDARLIVAYPTYGELEIVHYPLETSATATEPSRPPPAPTPGITTAWSPSMRAEVLARSGVPREGGERYRVEHLAAWALSWADPKDTFTAHYVTCEAGRVRVARGLERPFHEAKLLDTWSDEEQLQHEVYGAGMFANRTRGHCTSTAIYLATVMKAAGFPARIVTTIPPFDASDPDEVEMAADALTHPAVRAEVMRAAAAREGAYAAHTFVEVFAAGRWRRLDYGDLGSEHVPLGLNVTTLRRADLCDAPLDAWGRRAALRVRDDVFGHANPYSTVALSERYGVHASVRPPPPSREVVTVDDLVWFHSTRRPPQIPESARDPKDGSGHFLAHVAGWEGKRAAIEELHLRRREGAALRAPGMGDVPVYWRGWWGEWLSFEIRPRDLPLLTRGVPFTLSLPRTEQVEVEVMAALARE